MVGRTLGHYRVREQIGAGGMGVVYQACDERLERDVALKVLPAGTLADDAARRRFRKEALALSQLNHPNIATVHDFDTQEQTDFLVMELIPGSTLAEKLAAGPLSEKEISRLGGQLAQGLAAAHEQGVVHRDLKPGNLRVTPDGRLKILDFGLATLRRPPTQTATTVTAGETGVVMGTLPYMAPEQLRGEKADARSDIYSAGVVLYEMATGRRPFAETQGPQLVAAILQQTPPAPSALSKKVSPALEMIIVKALDKEPERRYQSARELAVDLERLTASVTVAAPKARRRRWPLAAAALALLVLVAAVYVLAGRGRAIESVAILPFVNASGSPDAEYLSDGMAETLINSLSQLPGLKVMSRNSVFRYKGREVEARAVGHELKVQAVLLGRLVQRGDNLSISAELVDARDGSRIWGEQYNRRLADVLAIQEEIGREISENLRLRLTGEQKKVLAKRHTQSPQAYQEYLKGLYFYNKKTGPSLQTAIGHFDRAIALDPSYARAYAGLADCHYLIGYLSAVPRGESLPKLQAAASKALQLDDTLAEAHVAQAVYKEAYEGDRAGAERHYRRALELNPACADAHARYGMNLTGAGRFEEAIAEEKRAQELEPVSPAVSNLLALAYHYARRYEEALEQYRKTLAMDPSFGTAHLYLGELYVVKSMYPEALAELKEAVKLMQQAPLAVSALGLAYARSGERAMAQKVLDGMLAERARQGYYPASRIALVYLGLGDKDRAFEWLAKAVEEGGGGVGFLKVNPLFDPLRSDPRFTELLRRMNLAP